MWTAGQWKDFEILDATAGERLERWGKFVLIRPDPQVIWQTPRENPRWHTANARYRRSKSGGGHWEFFDLPKQWTITYKDLTFGVKPFHFKHTGIFPEQAANWDWMRALIKKAGDAGRKNIKILNLFAYTGGATLACTKAGALVTHVDAAKGMVSWARENAALSGLSNAPVRWLVDDCLKFTERERRRQNRYDGIIMDPPSYGRGPKGEIWKLEQALHPLLTKCAALLSEAPLFFLINSYTTGFAPGVLSYMAHKELARFAGSIEAQELGLPVAGTGLVLPCGAACRFSAPV